MGQILDYGRFVEAKTRTVLVPSRPRHDLVEDIKTVGMDVVFPDGEIPWTRI